MNTEPDILYEDEHLVAVNKQSGLVVHSDGRTEEVTLQEWVAKRYPELEEVGGLHTLDSGRYIKRWGIVHRLDRATSGVLLIAKDDPTFLSLQRQFIEHAVAKTYHAVVFGLLDNAAGVIDLPIGRDRRDFRQWTVPPHARGTLRKAQTEYRVLGEYNEASLLELKPKTGRTHQLRVHLLALGHPIVGDDRYAPERGSMLGFTRLALHAKAITFLYDGRPKTIEAPYPADFAYIVGSFLHK